jgi:hypothetical protein
MTVLQNSRLRSLIVQAQAMGLPDKSATPISSALSEFITKLREPFDVGRYGTLLTLAKRMSPSQMPCACSQFWGPR